MYRPRVPKLVAAGITAAALTSVAAVAADDAKPSAEATALFKQLDGNSDGQLTREEAGGDKERLFKRLLRHADQDGNGQLTVDEFAAGLNESKSDANDKATEGKRPDREGGPGSIFKRLDANADGKLAADELPDGRREAMLKNLDTDQDQSVSREEFVAGAARMARRAREQGPAGKPRPEATQDERSRAIPWTAVFDTNGDGELSADEIAAAQESLKKLDANRDGRLDRKELSAIGGSRDGEARGDLAANSRRPDIDGLIKRVLTADKNDDGKVSLEEAPERLKRGFEKLDQNSDGMIDEAELRARFDKAKQKVQAKPAKAKKAKKTAKKPAAS